MESRVRVRFAPSPTGYLHVGGARTALFNWLFAKKLGGTFILRVEDTDLARSTDESVDAIFAGMRWLDLGWDEGPGAAEPHAPYFQTQRLDIYQKYAAELIANDRAFRCYLDKDELAAKRAEQEARGERPHYLREWSAIDDETRAGYEAEGRKFVVRFKSPGTGTIIVNDVLRGEVTFDIAVNVEDYVLIKNDGVPTYNYAVVIDDATMDVTHVIRGDDHLSNTPKQVAIFEALSLPVPIFCHLPMILGADKSKLSKRHGTTSVQKFEHDGFLPEALINYLVRLGWSHGDQEFFTRQEMIDLFSLEALNKSAAVFDFAKLEAVNGQYIRDAAAERLLGLMKPRWEAAGLNLAGKSDAWLIGVIDTLRERSKTLVQMVDGSRFYFDGAVAFDEAAVGKHLTDEGRGTLRQLRDHLAAGDDWSAAGLQAALEAFSATNDVKMGKISQPARVALTGKAASPGMYEMLALVGKDLTLKRFDEALGLAAKA